ncbi:hypothetical protein [Leptolyngbya sp. CCY15150]|nr:hypothetical protein [Leptolyngbya sp. CCY15150]
MDDQRMDGIEAIALVYLKAIASASDNLHKIRPSYGGSVGVV